MTRRELINECFRSRELNKQSCLNCSVGSDCDSFISEYGMLPCDLFDMLDKENAFNVKWLGGKVK